jgi:hypothetical protein
MLASYERRTQPRHGSRKGVRFVTDDDHWTSSVTNMLQQLHWPILQKRRAANKVIIMFRIVNNQVVIPTAALVKGHNHRFPVPFSRTRTCLFSFLPDTISLDWNNLPSSVVTCNSISSFNCCLFYVQWFDVGGDCSIYWYWWNYWPSPFKLSIHKISQQIYIFLHISKICSKGKHGNAFWLNKCVYLIFHVG